MKRFVLFSAIIIAMINLSACDPANYSYSYEDLKDSVSVVELIHYDNPDAVTLFEERDKVIPFDFNKAEVIETLETGQIDDFLNDFSEILFLMYWRHSDSPNGTSIRIFYENGDFEIVSYKAVYAGKFDSDGNVKEFIGGLASRGSFISLVNTYFNTELDPP